MDLDLSHVFFIIFYEHRAPECHRVAFCCLSKSESLDFHDKKHEMSLIVLAVRGLVLEVFSGTLYFCICASQGHGIQCKKSSSRKQGQPLYLIQR